MDTVEGANSVALKIQRSRGFWDEEEDEEIHNTYKYCMHSAYTVEVNLLM